MTSKYPVIHFEMPYQNVDRVVEFYNRAFGWKMQKFGPEMGDYVVAETTETKDGRPIAPGNINGGFYPVKPDWPAQYPSVVVATGDIEEAMKAVAEANGEVLGEPMNIPGIGLYVSFNDTEGNRASLLQPGTEADCPAASAAKVRTCLWFEGNGEEAVNLYVSLLPDSKIDSMFRTSPDADPLTIDFTLAGTPYQALNGGPGYTTFTEAASISVMTEDQAETDRLSDALIADGGEQSMCGWLKDRFGLSWQIVPKALLRLLSSEDREVSERVMQAMLKMKRIDIAALEAAAKQ